MFNVSNGEINRGSDLSKPSYYISGGYVFPQNGSIHAFGFTTNKESALAMYGLSAEATPTQQLLEINPNINKKTYHSYKVSEEKWQEVHESIFTG